MIVFQLIHWWSRHFTHSRVFNKGQLPAVYCALRPLNPFRLNISMHILHTVSYTILKVLTRRICFIIQNFSSWWSFPLFSWPESVIWGWYCKEKLDAGHSKGVKGLTTVCLACEQALVLGFRLLPGDPFTGPSRLLHHRQPLMETFIEIPAVGFQDYHYLVSLGLVVPKAFNALSKWQVNRFVSLYPKIAALPLVAFLCCESVCLSTNNQNQ